MSSDNPTGGDDQQETSSTQAELQLDPRWVCGFVDGEGCFSVAFHRNPYVRQTRGWHICPTFQVSQHRDNRMILEALVRFFGTGHVRDKGAASNVLVYSVYGANNVYKHIVPFFDSHPLFVKRRDFELFRAVIRLVVAKEHLEPAGFERAVRLAYAMNNHGRQRRRTLEEVLQGSSETVREARAPYVAHVMRQSELHGDMQSQAEMTWPLPVVSTESSNKTA